MNYDAINGDAVNNDTKIDDAKSGDAKKEASKLNDANIGQEKWLAGCAICNEGLSAEMDKIIDKHNLSQVTAAEKLSEVIEKRLGFPIYTPHALRKRYQRQKGKLAGQNVQATKPKGKSGTTAKARGNRKIPDPSCTTYLLRPRSKQEPDTLQDLLAYAHALAVGLQSWCDGEIKPSSNKEVETAQAILDALADIIKKYKKLMVSAQTEGERQEEQTT